MRRADRLFQLVQHLRNRRAATGQQLADQLGVSKRTVSRFAEKRVSDTGSTARTNYRPSPSPARNSRAWSSAHVSLPRGATQTSRRRSAAR